MDRRGFLSAVAAATAGVGGCSGVLGSGEPDPEHDVGMTASAFRPVTLTVGTGETVVWRNTSNRAHTVTAYDAGIPDGASYFASGGFADESAALAGYEDGLDGAIYSGERYEHAFETAGEFEYFCIPHERAGMVGTIVVE